MTRTKWSLLRRAALVLYPSINEGFGIVPFEAAEAGTPTLSTRYASLAEVLGDDVLSLALHDVDADAATAWSILSDPAVAARQTERIRARGERFTWSAVAQRTWAFYERVLHMPRRADRRLAERSGRGACPAPRSHLRIIGRCRPSIAGWRCGRPELNARLVSEPHGVSAQVAGRLQTLGEDKAPRHAVARMASCAGTGIEGDRRVRSIASRPIGAPIGIRPAFCCSRDLERGNGWSWDVYMRQFSSQAARASLAQTSPSGSRGATRSCASSPWIT